MELEKIEADSSLRKKIQAHNGHVFLRAGAGAGKSTLIAQKISTQICQGASLEEMAAITFTNKSALDLKWKIDSELHKKLKHAKDGKDKKLSQHIESEIKKIPSARISTIHSFCTSLLFAYPVQSKIDLAARSLDEEQEKIFIALFVEDYFQNITTRENAPILLECWQNVWVQNVLKGKTASTGTDKKSAVTKSLQDLNSYAREIILLDESIFHLKTQSELDHCLQEWFAHLKKKFCEEIFLCVSPKISNEKKEKLDSMLELFTASENFYEASKKFLLLGISLKDFPSNLKSASIFSEEEAAKKNTTPDFLFLALRIFIKILQPSTPSADIAEWYRNKEILHFFSFSDKQVSGCNKRTIFRAEVFAKELLRYQTFYALKDFFNSYIEYKQKNSVMDFSDQIYYMLDFVRTPIGREKISTHLKYLFVDEYQDTDPLQTEIFLRLCNLFAQNLSNCDFSAATHLFRVGDHKQSIYRFRGADVNLYQHQWENFTSTAQASSHSSFFLQEKIELNFRSQIGITSFVNFIFGSNQANKFKLEHYHDMYSPNMQTDSSKIFLPVQAGLFSHENKSKPDLRTQEALWIAEKIKLLLDNRDFKNKKKSVALLFNSMSSVSVYSQKLKDAGIPHYVHGRKIYEQAFPFNDFRLLIQFLAYPLDSAALAGFLRSPMAGFSDSEIYKMRCDSKLMETVDKKTFPPENAKENFLKLEKTTQEKLLTLNKKLFHLREVFTFYGLSYLLYSVFEQFPFLSRCAYYENSDDFLQFFSSLQKISQSAEGEKNSLQMFSQRLQELTGAVRDDEIIDIENLPQENGVHLMSIHSAKGLEFDVVFVPNLFSKKNEKEKILCQYNSFSEQISQQEKSPKFLFHLSNDFSSCASNSPHELEEQENEKEKVRLRYVAFTRAKENLFLFLPKKLNTKKEKDKNDKDKDDAEILHTTITNLQKENFPYLAIEEIAPQESHTAAVGIFRSTPLALAQEVMPTVRGASYFSATSLQRERQEQEKILARENNFFPDNTENSWQDNHDAFLTTLQFEDTLWGERSLKKFNSRKKGILLHQLFEWLDLKNPVLDDKLILAILKSQNMDIQEKTAAKNLFSQAVNLYKNSELFALVKETEIFGKEIPFSWQKDAGEKIAVGYMDLILKKDYNQIYLIDYKTNKIENHDDDFFRDQYKISMQLYADALQKYFGEQTKIYSFLYMTKTGRLIEMSV